MKTKFIGLGFLFLAACASDEDQDAAKVLVASEGSQETGYKLYFTEGELLDFCKDIARERGIELVDSEKNCKDKCYVVTYEKTRDNKKYASGGNTYGVCQGWWCVGRTNNELSDYTEKIVNLDFAENGKSKKQVHASLTSTYSRSFNKTTYNSFCRAIFKEFPQNVDKVYRVPRWKESKSQ